jgi:hypothetical protein
MDIDFQEEFPSTIAIIDTKELAKAAQPGRGSCGYKTRDLLPEFNITDIPRSHLYNAGNLAHFNLKFLLQLAIRAFRETEINHEQDSRLATLESIAQPFIKGEGDMWRDTPEYFAYWENRALKLAKKIELAKAKRVLTGNIGEGIGMTIWRWN